MAKKKFGTPTYSRISFLYQAASYLAKAGKQGPCSPTQNTPQPDADLDINMEHDGDKDDHTAQYDKPAPPTEGMSRKLLTELRAVTLKTNTRISPEIKRTICKSCDTLLIEGHNCTSTVENNSTGAKKPWADVLVIKCHTCGREKRFPVNASRQKRRRLRAAKGQQAAEASAPEAQPKQSKYL